MKYLLAFLIFAFNNVSAQTKDMMIRISEIEIDSNYLKEYNFILQEESRASVQLEAGVIAKTPIFYRRSVSPRTEKHCRKPSTYICSFYKSCKSLRRKEGGNKESSVTKRNELICK